MIVQRYVNFGEYKQEFNSAKTTDEMKEVFNRLIDGIQKQFDDILTKMVTQSSLGMNGTFVSGDVPPKSITVTSGLITKGL